MVSLFAIVTRLSWHFLPVCIYFDSFSLSLSFIFSGRKMELFLWHTCFLIPLSLFGGPFALHCCHFFSIVVACCLARTSTLTIQIRAIFLSFFSSSDTKSSVLLRPIITFIKIFSFVPLVFFLTRHLPLCCVTVSAFFIFQFVISGNVFSSYIFCHFVFSLSSFSYVLFSRNHFTGMVFTLPFDWIST